MISSSKDKKVKAIADGTVRGTFYDGKGWGFYVSIQQSDDVRALYCHLASFNCKAGQTIKAGDMIGTEGTTGNSTGIHLHLELRKSPYTSLNTISPAEYLGIENEIGEVKKVKETFKYSYNILTGVRMIKTPIENFKILYWDKPKKTYAVKNYCNGGYFGILKGRSNYTSRKFSNRWRD